MYRYHTVLTKFSIHISPWWTWSHFTKLYFWEALKPREGSPTTLSLGNWSCGLLYVAKTSNQTAIFAVLDATNCQDLSVQWDLPNTERISVGFHGTGNLKKRKCEKSFVSACWKLVKKWQDANISLKFPCLLDASEDLWLWPLRSSPSLWGSAFPSPRRAMRSSWSRPPWLSKKSSKNKLKWYPQLRDIGEPADSQSWRKAG